MAIDIQRLQAEITTDSVLEVYNRLADVQLGEVFDDLFGIDSASGLSLAILYPVTEHLAFGDHGDAVEPPAVFDGREGDGEGLSRIFRSLGVFR